MHNTEELINRNNQQTSDQPVALLKTNRTSQRLLRLNQVLAILPIGRSTWWKGCQSGRYPSPIKIGPRLTCWREEDILKLIADADVAKQVKAGE